MAEAEQPEQQRREHLGDLGSFIRAQRRLAELSQRELARIANVSDAYVSQLERGMHEPTIKVLRSIAGALDIRADTMLRYAGWLEDNLSSSSSGSSDVVSAIRADERLSNNQKQALLSVYRSFIDGTGDE